MTDDACLERLRELVLRAAAPGSGSGGSVLVGLVGRGIQASRTPAMHMREGARLGFRYVYVLIDFDRLGMPDTALGAFVDAAQALGFAGLNVTHPFKQSVLAELTELAPEASAIGAVNTVVFGRGVRKGCNTDSWGFAESFRDGMAGCALENVVQFGAGGAGAAVAYALLRLGVRDLAVIDSDPARSRALAARIGAGFAGCIRTEDAPERAVPRAGGIVNATPVGMAKYPGTPFPTELISARHWVADIIYFPRETELLHAARAKGCRTLAGTGMAVYQAVSAFELFTGAVPDRVAMTRHFEAAS
ncbi:MAG: shikimate dehydrogenase [Xanthobacteraceae bacterium]